MTLEYCSHGRRLLKQPHEDCSECEELYALMVARDSIKALERILSKRILEKATPGAQPHDH